MACVAGVHASIALHETHEPERLRSMLRDKAGLSVVDVVSLLTEGSEFPTQIADVDKATRVITSEVYSFSDEAFNTFQAGVQQYLNKAVQGNNVNVTVTVNLVRVSQSSKREIDLTMEVRQPVDNNHPPIDNVCGSHQAIAGQPHGVKIVSDGSDGCPEAKASAHEFLHHVGFDDAYAEPYPTTLHCDPDDIMGWGELLREYHARTIWQRYEGL